MSLFKLFRKKISKPQGIIAYLELTDWWLESFSGEEKEFIVGRFQARGNSFDSLTEGKVSQSSERPLRLLSNLAIWSIKEESRSLSYKILKKAESYVSTTANALDIHFFYLSKINIYYMDRDKPKYLDKAIYACRNQIAHAPKAAKAFKSEYGNDPLPSHKGYNQLASILSDNGRHQEVIKLCERAKNQGWGGDWDKRLERSRELLDK